MPQLPVENGFIGLMVFLQSFVNEWELVGADNSIRVGDEKLSLKVV